MSGDLYGDLLPADAPRGAWSAASRALRAAPPSVLRRARLGTRSPALATAAAAARAAGSSAERISASFSPQASTGSAPAPGSISDSFLV